MRKFATLAALTLCAGTAVAGGAPAANAFVNIGGDLSGTSTPPAVGTVDFAGTWCGAPWLWSGQQPGAACDAQHGHAQHSDALNDDAQNSDAQNGSAAGQ